MAVLHVATGLASGLGWAGEPNSRTRSRSRLLTPLSWPCAARHTMASGAPRFTRSSGTKCMPLAANPVARESRKQGGVNQGLLALNFSFVHRRRPAIRTFAGGVGEMRMTWWSSHVFTPRCLQQNCNPATDFPAPASCWIAERRALRFEPGSPCSTLSECHPSRLPVARLLAWTILRLAWTSLDMVGHGGHGRTWGHGRTYALSGPAAAPVPPALTLCVRCAALRSSVLD